MPAPPWELHALASDYDHLADRVPSLQRVKRVGASTVLWDARIAGHQLLWESRIVSEVPGRRIDWKSVSGIRCDAEIVLSPGSGTGTTVTLRLRYRPRTPLGWLAARLGVVDRSVRSDLEAFARLVADGRAAATAGRRRGLAGHYRREARPAAGPPDRAGWTRRSGDIVAARALSGAGRRRPSEGQAPTDATARRPVGGPTARGPGRID